MGVAAFLRLVYSSVAPSLTNGQDVAAQGDAAGNLKNAPTGSDGAPLFPTAQAGADGMSNATKMSMLGTMLSAFNGTTWDRVRAGIVGVVASATGWMNVLPGAQYLASLPTLVDQQLTTLTTTLSGALRASLADDIGGEDRSAQAMRVAHRWNVTPLSANATTTLFSGAGIFGGLVISAPGATGNTIDVYDNTAGSGTEILGQLDATALTKGQFVGVPGGGMICNTGCTVVIATGTAAKVSALWRPVG